MTHLRRADPVMKSIIRRVGPYAMEYREPTFDTLVRSIIFQQVSGAVGRVFIGRLRDAMPDGVITPAAILNLTTEQMRAMGLSRAKTLYIQELAHHTVEGSVVFEHLHKASDEEVIATLTQVKGIGVWTSQMFLMFALRRPDVLPVGDLGVRKAIQMEYRLDALPTPAEMLALAEPWRPYCTVASWYLWRSLDGIAAI
jgi:DNA-3-methyladenine glycosylase II